MGGIYTVYPRGWFQGRSRGGSGRAKCHAAWFEKTPYRGQRGTAFCGVTGEVVDYPFKATEGDAITCGRCAKAAQAKRREA